MTESIKNHLTPKDIAVITASHCTVEVWEMGSATKRNEVVQARELYVLACCDLGLAGDSNWEPVRQAIDSQMIDRAFRQMRTRGEKRQAAKGPGGWFARTRAKIIADCCALADDRAQTLPGVQP